MTPQPRARSPHEDLHRGDWLRVPVLLRGQASGAAARRGPSSSSSTLPRTARPPFPSAYSSRPEALAAWFAEHGRELTETEQYAAAKMRLLRGFDEIEGMRDHGRRLVVDGENIEELLAAAGAGVTPTVAGFLRCGWECSVFRPMSPLRQNSPAARRTSKVNLSRWRKFLLDCRRAAVKYFVISRVSSGTVCALGENRRSGAQQGHS